MMGADRGQSTLLPECLDESQGPWTKAGSRGRRIGLVAKARGRVQLLQMEQEGAVVPALVTLVVERLEHVAHRLDDRQLRQADLLGRGQYRVEVLDEVADWRAWAEVAVDHAPAVLLQHTAVGMAAGQRHRDLGGVGAAGARE
jgi:hypothetical protein